LCAHGDQFEKVEYELEAGIEEWVQAHLARGKARYRVALSR
jgi:hypothetical protein